MADQSRVVRILLQAVDQASAVIGKVQSGAKSFAATLKKDWEETGASIGSLTKEFKELLNNKLVQGIGFAGLLGALKQSWAAADEFDASLRKLSASAKITEVPLGILQRIAQEGHDTFKLSSVQANDFAVELAKLASKAGDVEKAGPGLQSFLDIGAARGLNASDTLKAVQQAILGIDEGTDKLFNKNPSVIYKEFADAIGTSVGKLTDQQKAQALLNAALADGEKVRGEYERWLGTTAGLQEQAKVKTQEAMVTLGHATESIRNTFLPVIARGAELFSDFVGGIQLLGVDAAYYFGLVGPAARGMAGDVLTALSSMIGESRIVLSLFGDSATALADRLGDAGVKMTTQAQRDKRNLVTARKEMYDEVLAAAGVGEKKITDTAYTGAKNRTEISDEEKKEREKLATELAIKHLQVERGWTEDQAKEFVRRRELIGGWWNKTVSDLKAGYLEMDHLNVILAAGFDKQVIPALKQTTTVVKELTAVALPQEEAIQKVAKAWGVSADKVREWLEGQQGKGGVKGLPPIARDAVAAISGIGDALGILDEKAGAALQSATGLADSLLRLKGDPSALIGVVGNMVSLFAGIFSDSASAQARETLRKHEEAVQANTRRIGDLIEISSPGRAIAGALRVSEALGDPATLTGVMGGFGVLDPGKFAGLLGKFGLTIADITGLAKDFGLDGTLRTKDGGFNLMILGQLFDMLKTSEPGRFGQDFGNQFQFITRALGLGAIGGNQEFGAFAGLASKFGASGITDILGQFDVTTSGGRAGGLAALRKLFLELNSGNLDASAFGDLSGGQFAQLLEQLITILADPDKIIGGFDLTPQNPRNPFGYPEGGFPGDGPTVMPPVDLSLANIGSLTEVSNDLLGSIDATLRDIRDGAVVGRIGGTSFAPNVVVNVLGGPSADDNARALAVAIDREMAILRDQYRANSGTAVRAA